MSVMMQPPAIIFWSHGFFFWATIQYNATDALQYCIVFQKHKNFHCNLWPPNIYIISIQHDIHCFHFKNTKILIVLHFCHCNITIL